MNPRGVLAGLSLILCSAGLAAVTACLVIPGYTVMMKFFFCLGFIFFVHWMWMMSTRSTCIRSFRRGPSEVVWVLFLFARTLGYEPCTPHTSQTEDGITPGPKSTWNMGRLLLGGRQRGREGQGERKSMTLDVETMTCQCLVLVLYRRKRGFGYLSPAIIAIYDASWH